MRPFCSTVVLALWLAAAASAQQPPDALEYFGYARNGTAVPDLAFLRQGGRIIIAAVGDRFEDTYRLIRIGVDSVVIEDTSERRRQNLPLIAPKSGSESTEVEQTPNAARSGNTRTTRRPARPTVNSQQ